MANSGQSGEIGQTCTRYFVDPEGLVVTLKGSGCTVLLAELNLGRNAIIFRAIRCPSGPRMGDSDYGFPRASDRASWHSSRLLTQ
jgi:hypothetical protein